MKQEELENRGKCGGTAVGCLGYTELQFAMAPDDCMEVGRE